MRLNELIFPNMTKGRIYLGSMPGRKEELDSDEATISAKGITTVIRLTDNKETKSKSKDYYDCIKHDELKWAEIYYPVPDYSAPINMDSYIELIDLIIVKLIAGESIVIHCGAGIGRTATLAVALLLKLQFGLTDAKMIVSQAGSFPENVEQEAFLAKLKLKLLN